LLAFLGVLYLGEATCNYCNRCMFFYCGGFGTEIIIFIDYFIVAVQFDLC